MRTLYVTDDEPVAIRVMQRGLEREGFVVETFHNGRDVLERIHDVAPDGSRFVAVFVPGGLEDDASSRNQIVVVQNWFEELRRLVPTN